MLSRKTGNLNRFNRSAALIALCFIAGLVTACAGGVAPSPTPRAGGGGGTVSVETLPPRSPIPRTPTGIPPSETPRPPTNTPYTPQPTITSSGPTLDSSAINAKKIKDGAPLTVGPFTLVKDDKLTTSSDFGLTLYYRTSEGALYKIIIFITASAGGSRERYAGITAGLKGAQQLSGLGDEAVITAAPNQMYIAMRWRNVAMELYRPDPRGTTPKPITDDDAKALMNALYQLLQQSSK